MDSGKGVRWKAALIFLTVFALYFFTRSASLDEWDSYQFAMGVREFNLWKHQPHPPGYPLYVFFGWVGAQLFHWDPGFSLQIVSCLGGAIFVATWFVIIRREFDERFAWLLTVCLPATPIVWMTSTKVLSDSIATAFLSLEILCAISFRTKGRMRDLLGASFFGAIAAGVRPQLVAVAIVILVLTLRQRRAPAKFWFLGLSALIVSALAWLIPMWIMQARLTPELPAWSVYPKQLLQQWSWRLNRPKVFIGAHGMNAKYLGLKFVTHFFGFFGLGLGFIYSKVTLIAGTVLAFAGVIRYAQSFTGTDRKFWKAHWIWMAIYIAIIFCCLPPYQRYYLIVMPLLLVVLLRGLLALPRYAAVCAVVFLVLLVSISIPLAIESHTDEAPVRKFVRYLEKAYPPAQRSDVLLLLSECTRPVQWYAPQFSIIRDVDDLTSIKPVQLEGAKGEIYTDDPTLALPAGWRLNRLALFHRSILIAPKHRDIGIYRVERIPSS
jgi:hypothetical protein